MFREFGLSDDIVDMPVNSALANIRSEIILAVKKYEPRAKITDVNFEADTDGKLNVRVKFKLEASS